MVAADLGKPFPQEPEEQLWGAIGAVFGSWMNPRANVYRRLHDIPASWGTAVNVQAMVFGNMGDDLRHRRRFTRDPSTGEKRLYGEFLVNAQGEDVVAGIRTPQPLRRPRATRPASVSMEEAHAGRLRRPGAGARPARDALSATCRTSSSPSRRQALHAADAQREAHRRGRAPHRGRDGRTGLITRTEAVLRVDPAALDQLLHPTLDPKAPAHVIAKGLAASPGAASGIVVFDADEAESARRQGEPVILVRIETSPEDIHGMHAARGILTARGGMTSHAAVVARGMGRPCVAGGGGIAVDLRRSRR